MNTKLSERILHVLLIFIFILGTIGMPLKTVGARPAEDTWSNARFIAWPIRSHLSLFDWAGGGLIIYLPFATVWTSTDQYGRLELPYGYGYPAGSIITIDDGTIAKELIVAPLIVTYVDPDTETVSGTTNPNARVDIENLCDGAVCASRHAIADENGNWQMDFSIPGSEEDEQINFDLVNGTQHWVIQYDEDGDATAVNWRAFDPIIDVSPEEDRMNGSDWPLGGTVDISIDDPLTDDTPDFTTSATVNAIQGGVYQTEFSINLKGQYDLKAGDKVIATDGRFTKETVVTSLVLLDVNTDTDIVSGSADEGSIIDLWICKDNNCVQRNETANPQREWAANFAEPGEQVWEHDIFDIQRGTSGSMSQTDEDGDLTTLEWYVYFYTLHVKPSASEVHGHDWPGGTTITLTIDDDNNPDNGVLYTETKNENADTSCGDPCFKLNGIFNLEINQIVTMSDGFVSKTVVISPLDILNLDPETETVSGVADPGSQINIEVLLQDGMRRSVTAASDGSWVADFSVAGDEDFEQTTADILNNSIVRTVQINPDGSDNGTEDLWSNAHFVAWPIRSHLSLFDWAGGGLIIYLPFTFATVWTSTDQYGRLELPYGYGYPADSIITIDDGTVTKKLIVAPLDITDVDPDTETVSGTTNPNARVDIENLCDGSVCASRHAIADENGNWKIDFSIPGNEEDEQATFDLINGMHHSVIQYDEDGDATAVDWYAPQWPIGINSGGPYTAYVGESVTFDASGSFAPDGEVLTYGWDLDNDGQYNNAIGLTAATTFDQTGEYTISLRALDSLGLAYKDTTTVVVKERQPDPILGTIDARYHENEILGYGWSLDSEITMTIDHPSNGAGVDYTDTQTVVVSDKDPNQTLVSFRLWENGFELENGQIVTMSDGTTIKTHVVAVPTITAVNPLTDIVEGLAAPSAEILVDLLDATRHETADTSGRWSANFRVPGDEDWETQTADIWSQTEEGEARFQDEDGDSTTTNWGFPYLMLTLRDDGSSYNWIEGWPWPARSPIYLAVDDPATPQNPDYTDVQRSEESGYVGFDYVDFHDHPGFSITLSNGYLSKTIIIPIFSVTGYDLANDTISGTSNPFTTVEVVGGCPNDDCSKPAKRKVVTDSEGNWLANFAVSNNPGEVIYDIQPGDDFVPQISDVDWDETIIRWSVPSNQPPIADAGGPYSGYAGSSISLNASNSADPDNNIVSYEWDLDNDGEYDVTGITATLSLNQIGAHTIGLQVTDDGGLSDTDTVTVTVLPWTLKGFYQPVDMNGIYNAVKGGSTVPLKFEIFAGSTELTDVAYIKSLTYAQISCDATAITDEIETTATGNTSLRYADGQFIYNWKTPKTAGKCYRVTMTAIDNSTLVAYFKLK